MRLMSHERTFTVPFQETVVVTPEGVNERTPNAVRLPAHSLTSLHSGARDADISLAIVWNGRD
jgi:hypothetical protein